MMIWVALSDPQWKDLRGLQWKDLRGLQWKDLRGLQWKVLRGLLWKVLRSLQWKDLRSLLLEKDPHLHQAHRAIHKLGCEEMALMAMFMKGFVLRQEMGGLE